jgi:thiamine-phosphate pyrophosphorylase
VLVDSLGVAEAALEAGAPTLQVRLKTGTDRDHLRLATTIAERCRDAGATCVTRSKRGLPEPIGVEGVRAVALAVNVPVIAISGITPDLVDEVIGAGAHGVAVISAVADSPDPHIATHDLLLAVAKAAERWGDDGARS